MPTEFARLIEIRHRCDCRTATEPPGPDGDEHVLRIDGVDFPWHISEKGPVVHRGEVGYTVTVEIMASEVDAVGVPVWELRKEDCDDVSGEAAEDGGVVAGPDRLPGQADAGTGAIGAIHSSEGGRRW